MYLDNILIYSNSRKEHITHLRLVLDRLRKFALYRSRKKCKFYTDYLEFLGFIISATGVLMDRSKVAAIEEWPTLKNLQDVRGFLGFANFY